MNNLVGYWLSHKERYDFLQNQVEEEVPHRLDRRGPFAENDAADPADDQAAEQQHGRTVVFPEIHAAKI